MTRALSSLAFALLFSSPIKTIVLIAAVHQIYIPLIVQPAWLITASLFWLLLFLQNDVKFSVPSPLLPTIAVITMSAFKTSIGIIDCCLCFPLSLCLYLSRVAANVCVIKKSYHRCIFQFFILLWWKQQGDSVARYSQRQLFCLCALVVLIIVEYMSRLARFDTI